MGIKVEFNPNLALRNIEEYKKGTRKLEECVPEKLEEGKTYQFLKEGQRLYWLEGEQPLIETKGNQNLSRPLASIIILEATHFKEEKKTYTKGKYKVIKLLGNNARIYFEGFEKASYPI